jgi:nitrogen fixation/metabolism regulation signal transduction histidine kinase
MKWKLGDIAGAIFLICVLCSILCGIGVWIYQSRETIYAFFLMMLIWTVLLFLPVGGLASDILESKGEGRAGTDTAKRFLTKIALIVVSVACAFTLLEMSLGIGFALGMLGGAYLTTAGIWIFCLKPHVE